MVSSNRSLISYLAEANSNNPDTSVTQKTAEVPVRSACRESSCRVLLALGILPTMWHESPLGQIINASQEDGRKHFLEGEWV